jgi:hypothetical protein
MLARPKKGTRTNNDSPIGRMPRRSIQLAPPASGILLIRLLTHKLTRRLNLTADVSCYGRYDARLEV